MYENYADRYPLPPFMASAPATLEYQQYPVERVFPGAITMQSYNLGGHMVSMAAEYTRWRDEALAYHLTCSCTSGLSVMPTLRFKGPDAKKFLKSALINKFEKFPVNTSKHATTVTPHGLIVSDGVVFRLGEDDYEVANCSPYLDYELATKGQGLDMTVENLMTSKTIFQLQGPASLQVVEEALGEDFHDLRFGQIKQFELDGVPALVLRFGMANCLGYEIHVYEPDRVDLAEKIFEVGRKYGIRRLGALAYMTNHVPGGSMQCGISGSGAAATDPDFVHWMAAGFGLSDEDASIFLGLGNVGSLPAEDIAETYATPFEMGLGAAVDLENPDLPGREALLAYKADPKRKMVTLKWNEEDILDVMASAFRAGDEEPYDQFDNPRWNNFINGGVAVEFDRVLDMDGNKVGFAGGRTMDVYNRAMVSFAIMSLDQCELGNQVLVVWGRPGSRQKLIRAEVVPTPFNTHIANKSFDVNTIPRLGE